MWLTASAAALLSAASVAAPAAHASGDSSGGDGDDLPLGSMYHVVDQIGARDLWDDGITGEGVNIAVIDTGVTPVTALSEADKVVAVVDLSGESALAEARYLDTYGHGTHIAGIIAGRTPGADPAEAEDHPEWFMGVAPDAGIISVKVADNTGSVDVSQMIAAVEWVTEHAVELNIRVLNLSYSSGSSSCDARSALTRQSRRRARSSSRVSCSSLGSAARTACAMSASTLVTIGESKSTRPAPSADFHGPSCRMSATRTAGSERCLEARDHGVTLVGSTWR